MDIPLIVDEDKICRYCLEQVDNNYKYCNCTGSQGYMHHECLVKWYENNDFKIIKCEICNANFNIRVIQNINNSFIYKFKIILILLFFIIVNSFVIFIVPTYIDNKINRYKIYTLFKLFIIICSYIILLLLYKKHKRNIQYTLIHTV